MITEWSIKKADGRGKIRISVIRSARKSLGLEVRDANTVLARIPTRVSDRELKAFVENHRSWILEKTAVMAEREENRKSTPAPPPELLSKTDRMKIQLKIGKRVRYYCETMGVPQIRRIPPKQDRSEVAAFPRFRQVQGSSPTAG